MDKATKEWLIKWRLLGSPRTFQPEQVELFGQMPEIALDYVPDGPVAFLWVLGTYILDGRKEHVDVAIARGVVEEIYPVQPDLFGGGKYYFTGSVDGLPTQHATLTELLKKLVRDLQLRQRPGDPPEFATLIAQFAAVVAKREQA